MTTRFPNGVNNAESMTTLTNMPGLDPTRLQTVYDDFNGSFDALTWLVTETQAGATQAGTAGAGGRLLLTNSAAIGDVNAIGTPLASYRFVAGKRFYAKARFAVSDITNVRIMLGFANTITTLLPTIGAFVDKVGTTLTVSNANSGNITNIIQDASGLAAGQFCTLGMEYDGKNLNLYYGQESTAGPLPDRKIASIDQASLNLNTATDLVAFFGMKNVNAVANTATLDYAFFAMER